MERLELCKPDALVRREYREWPAVPGLHFVFLEDHLVFAGVQGAAFGREFARNRGVAIVGLRFVIVIRVYRLCTERMRQLRN